MTYHAIKGMDDVLPSDIALYQHIERCARSLCHIYNYSEIRTPLLEFTDLFTRSVGQETDIVQKEMYAFTDNKDRSLALRPEGTAPVVRAFLEHYLYKQATVQKLFYMGPMFRYERPQAGRKRQFHQVGVEVFGGCSPLVDAEVMSLLLHLLKAFGVEDTTLMINSSGCATCRPSYTAYLKEFFVGKRLLLCDNCNRRYDTNPLRMLDCKQVQCQQLFAPLASMDDYLCAPCVTHFGAVQHYLYLLGFSYVVSPKLVRGLDYYTGVVFEVTSADLGAQDAVGAGGRYDRLVADMGGPDVPAVGFAIGVERVVKILQDAGGIVSETKKEGAFFIPVDQRAVDDILVWTHQLRQQGVRSQYDYEERSVKASMRYANKAGFRYVLVVGEREIADKRIAVKDMVEGHEDTVGFQEVVDYLSGRNAI